MIAYLLEIGPTISGAMGSGPIGWRDLQAWQWCVGIRLLPWQCRLLVQLSKEYLGFQRDAEDPNCPSPLLDEGFIASRREQVSKALTLGFKGLIANQQKRKARD